MPHVNRPPRTRAEYEDRFKEELESLMLWATDMIGERKVSEIVALHLAFHIRNEGRRHGQSGT